ADQDDRDPGAHDELRGAEHDALGFFEEANDAGPLAEREREAVRKAEEQVALLGGRQRAAVLRRQEVQAELGLTQRDAAFGCGVGDREIAAVPPERALED